MELEFDFIVIGAGSAGCAVAHGLAMANRGTVCVLEAGPSDAVPQVKVPFGLLYTMGSGRDWKFRSAPQAHAGGRNLSVARGKMVGGSSSINSMAWFRGRKDDFDGWSMPGWGGDEVWAEFEQVEAAIQPDRLPHPHGLAEAFGTCLGSNGHAPPTPERESAGVVHVNMRNGRRWSAADAFLRPAQKTGRVEVLKGANTDRIALEHGRARTVHLCDGRTISARKAIVVSAGSIGSPAILLRSGIGPGNHLRELNIDVAVECEGVGRNLHDHPGVGLHHVGPRSGYGLTADQALAWAISPFQWLLKRSGRMTSNFVEAVAFFRAGEIGSDGDGRPDIQTHLIPYMMGYKGKTITTGSGYFADVCVCRPKSRGRLTLTSSDPNDDPRIDLGVLSDPADLYLMVAGIKRLRTILATAEFGGMQAPEAHPGPNVSSDEELASYIHRSCGTAYHPVGTVAMGTEGTPLDPSLRLRGVDGLYVADASVMPKVTSANTNAPSMMIGHRAAKLILADN